MPSEESDEPHVRHSSQPALSAVTAPSASELTRNRFGFKTSLVKMHSRFLASMQLYCCTAKAANALQVNLANMAWLAKQELNPSCTQTPARLDLLLPTISIMLFFLRRAFAAVHSASGVRTGKMAKLRTGAFRVTSIYSWPSCCFPAAA
jgi:hypothetical protein